MPSRSFLESLGDWEAMQINLEPFLAELPHLAEDHAALATLLAEGRQLESGQDIHKRMLRETNEKRSGLLTRGRKVRGRLVAGLQCKFGPESVMLRQFGIEPRKPQRRGRQSPSELRAKKVGEAVPTTPQE